MMQGSLIVSSALTKGTGPVTGITISYDKQRQLFAWCTALVAALICLGTLLPSAGLPAAPGSDKTHHLVGFAALTLPAALFYPRALRWVLPLAIFYGALIEIIQPFVGRHGDINDFIADGAGAVVGVVLGTLLRFAIKPRGTYTAAHGTVPPPTKP